MSAASETSPKQAMLEERVETGLADLLASYRSDYRSSGAQNDLLDEQFMLLGNQPLPQLNQNSARAFAAQDLKNPDRSCYALLLDKQLPYRLKVAETLANLNNQHLQRLLAAGTLRISALNEDRYCVFLEKPIGQSLTEYKQSGRQISEHALIDRVLQPLASLLKIFADKELVHGSVHPDHVFIGDNIQLGECVSNPCGYFQPYHYEPLERLMADEHYRGVGDNRSDLYALAMLAFETLYGLDHIAHLSRDEFIRTALNIGTYQLLSNNLEISDNMASLFRGLLNDNRDERWTIEQLSQWLSGKRFNMLVQPTPKEATRPLDFAGQQFYNRRSLANGFHKNWRATLKELRGLRLDRWFEMSLHRPEQADRIERVMRIGGEASGDKINNDMLCRLICILDPTGPIRTIDSSVCPEGIGLFINDCLRENKPPQMQQVLEIIEQDIPNYWAYLTETSKPAYISQVLWKLQRVRPYLKMRAIGFGIERLLYELNTNLPCQSDLLRGLHVIALPELLKSLDAMAMRAAPETSLLDRHLIAFVASKLDIGKEIRLLELSALPSLASNQELVALRILSRAQQRYDKMPLIGLSTWAAMRVEKMLDDIHNRNIRKRLKLALKSTASSGYISEILNIIINREIANKDYDGFVRAVASHKRNKAEIEQLQNPGLIDQYAQDLGGKAAVMLAYIALVVSSYLMLAKLI